MLLASVLFAFDRSNYLQIQEYAVRKQVRIEITAKLILIMGGGKNVKFCQFEYTPPQAYGGGGGGTIVSIDPTEVCSAENVKIIEPSFSFIFSIFSFMS